MKIRFANNIVKDIKKLDYKVQTRIKKKLLWFAEKDDPRVFADFLKDSEIGQYRFRIGNYRVVFDVKDDIIKVNLIGHRRDIYK